MPATAAERLRGTAAANELRGPWEIHASEIDLIWGGLSGSVSCRIGSLGQVVLDIDVRPLARFDCNGK